MTRADVSLADVRHVVERLEPITAAEVCRELDLPFADARGTVWNRLVALVDDGVLIRSDDRPARFAVNELRGIS